MKGNKFDKTFLRIVFLINLIVLIPIIMRKPSIKDWVLVYLFNAVTNSFIDNYLTERGTVKYPVRFLPKRFNTHILFDYLIYPTLTILYNQITIKDKPFVIIFKTLYFTIPMFFIEFWAVRKTGLIKWNKGWKWYHSFFSVTLKSLITRLFVEIIRVIDRSQKGYN